MSIRAVQEMLYGDLDPTSLLERIALEATELIDTADGSSVLMLSEGTLRTVATSDTSSDQIGREMPADELFVEEVFARRVPFCCEDILCDERIPVAYRGNGRTRSVIVAPLFAGDEPIGLLTVISRQPSAFDGEDVCSVLRVCSFAGVAVAASIETADAARAVVEAMDQPMLMPDGRGQVARRHGDAERVSEFLADVTRPGSVAALRTRQRLRAALVEGQLSCVVQPVVELADGRLAGAEALARFPGLPRRGPDVWFAEAHAAGLGIELETLAVRRALDTLEAMPGLPTIGINVTPAMLLSGDLMVLLQGYPGERITIELTEHLAIGSYDRARRMVDDLRTLGVKLAIDDVGAGYSSFRHVAELEPERIKLDRAFIAGVESNRTWAQMAEALVRVASGTGASLVAEGIETQRQLDSARELGIGLGQGYLIARPCEPAAMPWSFDHLVAPCGQRSLVA
jgi:EAL domain-containing protein (putative c-di-GMP-specific phosphodiesterase class I)